MVAGEIWIIADTDKGGIIYDNTLELCTEAKKLAEHLRAELCVVLIGRYDDQEVEIFERYSVNKLYILTYPLLDDYSSDGYTAAISQMIVMGKPDVVLASWTSQARDYLPRVAARLKIGIITGCVMVKSGEEKQILFTKPTHMGKSYSYYSCTTIPIIATIVPGAIGIDPPGLESQFQKVICKLDISNETIRTKVISREKGDLRYIDLREADRIVCGGKGIVDKNQWKLLEELADELEAVVGGSRKAVDLGFITREKMVGQTGKNVNPKLYLAVGISGAYYHMRGVNCENIIAINIDSNAQIFKQCKLGVVGNAEELLPKLTQKIRGSKEKKGI